MSTTTTSFKVAIATQRANTSTIQTCIYETITELTGRDAKVYVTQTNDRELEISVTTNDE